MSGLLAAELEFALLKRLETLRLKLCVDPRVVRREMAPGEGEAAESWSAGAVWRGGGWLGFPATLVLGSEVGAGWAVR